MPLVDKGMHLVAGRLPKVISPKTHAIIDYAVAASFVAVGAKTWRRNRAAAIGAFIAGGSGLALAMLTDYPGGIAKIIDFSRHLEIEGGRSGVIASMPNLIGFSKGLSWCFRTQAMGIAAVAGMTRTGDISKRRRRERAA